MKNHVKVYMTAFGYSPGEWMPCEISAIEQGCCRGNGTGIDIHHVDARGMGGSKEKDVISNLMCLCRECHLQYGDKVQYLDWMELIHRDFMRKEINSTGEKILQ